MHSVFTRENQGFCHYKTALSTLQDYRPTAGNFCRRAAVQLTRRRYMGAARLHWQCLKLHVCAQWLKWQDTKLQWQDTKLQWQDTKLQWQDTKLQWQDTKMQWQDTKMQWQDTKLQWQDTKLQWQDTKLQWQDTKLQ
jgi:hypothetical protein